MAWKEDFTIPWKGILQFISIESGTKSDRVIIYKYFIHLDLDHDMAFLSICKIIQNFSSQARLVDRFLWAVYGSYSLSNGRKTNNFY